ncbi:MAG: hypothetical protein ACLUD1_07055 [Clostridia bacterium]
MIHKFVVILTCILIGFVIGRQNVHVGKKEVIKYIEGKTIRDTIMNWKSDTMYLAGELRYKYVYRTDTIYKDVPVVNREKTIKATMEDWNLVRKYKKTLFDDKNGKLSLDFSVQYNKLRYLSYIFTPINKEIINQKRRIFIPFISISFSVNNFFSVGGGCFYYDLGFLVEYSHSGLNFGILYKF